MPEGEPRAQRLADVDPQNADCAAVANKADDDGSVQNGFEFGALQDVNEKSSEECACAEGDDAEIKKNPEAEGEAIVHVGLVQPVIQAEASRVDSDGKQDDPG